MLLLLSPAKALDFDSPVPAHLAQTQPVFAAQAQELVAVLARFAPQQLAQLMGLSDKLAALNVARYAALAQCGDAVLRRQALLAFNGDVYTGLAARTLAEDDWHWAQQHVRILSGLYGVLRPLDLIAPHRLEMGTALATKHGNTLYQFWGARIGAHIDACAASLPPQERCIVNLASQEYARALDAAALQTPLLHCVFEDFKGGSYKVISFHAKRARGLMARFAVQRRARSAADLQAFDRAGYAFAAAASSAQRLVFRRKGNAD